MRKRLTHPRQLLVAIARRTIRANVRLQRAWARHVGDGETADRCTAWLNSDGLYPMDEL